MADNTPNASFFQLSRPAILGEVDAFLSHSWSDCAEAKWDAIQNWRLAFKKQNGREPTLWIDKFCIDQSSIDTNLLCLPVFMSGTERVLVLAGETYLARLWCVLELFVFVEMGGAREELDLALLDSDLYSAPESETSCQMSSSSRQSIAKLRGLLDDFDGSEATCYKPSDKDRLISIIEAGCGGLGKFNSRIRELFLDTRTSRYDSQNVSDFRKGSQCSLPG